MSATTLTWQVVCSRHGVVYGLGGGVSRAQARRRAKEHKARDRRLWPNPTTPFSVTTRDTDPALLVAKRDRLRILAHDKGSELRWLRAWRNLGETIGVAMCREDALIAWDSVEAGSTSFPPERMARLLDVARVAYRVANPKTRGDNLWVFESEGTKQTRYRDVVCRFCRVKLLTMAEMGVDYTEKVRAHTERCALGFLAGLPSVTILADGTVEAS